MREILNTALKANISLDEDDSVRQIHHLEQPWESSQATPLMAAIEYLHESSGMLEVQNPEVQNLQKKVSFVEPLERGVEYVLGDQKEQFDATTILFNQTYLNVPVWRAGVTLTVKHNPNRVVMVTDTSEKGINADLPSREKIEEHRQLFALAAADQRLRVLGLEDQARAAGVATEDAQTRTAGFIRRVLGRDVGEVEPGDDARAIRGRFFVYRYDEKQRLPESSDSHGASPEELPESGVETAPHTLPTLYLPPVDASIQDGDWRVVSEVTFALTTTELGPLNWRALIDVETDSVLLLEPLVAGLNGLVFHRDPITSTGNAAHTPNRNNSVLNPLRTSVVLPNLDAPVNGVQSLRGRFAVVADVNAPGIAPPTKPAGTDFNFDVRTDDFAAVNAYYHTDRFFALIESLGFPIATYFDNTTFPVRVDHRDNIGLSTSTINAWCQGNGMGGIGYAGYSLNDLSDTANPLGRACDSRVHLHELGGHGILYEHVDSPNFRFAHSAGDSLSAILHAPESQAPDRFRYAPWNSQNTRRFDRDIAQGWAWGGSKDDRQYQSEEILATTLFRVYRSIGGDSTDLGQRRFASRMTMYLILRAISTLTPATNPRNALEFANALMMVDLLNWTSEGVFGGAYNKVIRWSFEKQGLYQAPGAPTPVRREGEPPEIDVYIDDGRGGEYPYRAVYWNNSSVWNRHASDGGAAHEEPVAGATNFAYVRIKNRGTAMARNVRVRGYHRRPGGGTVWPDDFQPLTTAELAAGTLAARNAEEKVVGPFAWVPAADAQGNDGLLMVVSADGDASNVMHVTSGESIPEWRLVPNDNNIGLRNVVPAADGTEQPSTPQALRASATAGMVTVLHPLRLSKSKLENGRIRSLTIQFEEEEPPSPVEEAVPYRLAAEAPVSREAEASAADAGWGMRRHAAIATAAMERLQSERARAAILRILDESGDASLGEAARWADRLRSSDRPRDPATERFLGDRRNRAHTSWHYVNLPLGLDGYDRERYPEFTRADDVLQITMRCIESLRNPGQRARFEEIIALRWLSHLVGDLHQPVHVGCGYIANARTAQAHLVSDPEDAIGLPSDRGGNELLLPIGTNLHSFWDSQLGPDLVPAALEAASDEPLVRQLARAWVAPAAAREEEGTPGRVIGWVNASLAAAREAYRQLRITGYLQASGDYSVEWEGESAYRQRCAPIVSERMTAAAANLAALLDSIWP